MVGRHSTPQHRPQSDRAERQRTRTVEIVDSSGTAHLLSVAAAENGLSRGRYTAICGGDVLPAALVARQARYCRLCAPVPTQRSRGTR
jgi:hypothetical protein